jgi:hypothetical protein
MSAHTLGSTYYESGSIPGGDGLKFAAGTGTCTASYDTNGSTLDLSSVFADKVYMCVVNIDAHTHRATWVPGTSNASSDMKVHVDDNAGAEIGSTTDLSTTPGAFEWWAVGTDG